MKKLILILVSIVASAVFASVTISVSTKTVQKTGGGGTITVTGTGVWTAVSDSGWITVKSGASGDGDGKVMFTVGENTTADTRIGHIDVSGNIYTITQYGYTGTISPTSVTVDRNGKTGTVLVTVDAGVEWSATPNVDWITVTPTSGRNVGQVTYTVATYPGVVSRSGSIAIAGQTFTVTQTGVDVNLEPAVLKVKPEADIVQVDITALAATKWTVTPNADWVSVLDKEQGYGDYVLSLVVNANPSFAKRTTTVAVGTATLTIIQEGKPTAELAIDPEHAEASASGAYGNVAVYATPDAPWTAESLTPWLTISQGKEGSGNGNIKYVTSPNPTLEEREGLIRITPPYKEPELDLNAGLACWMPSFTSIGGDAQRYFLWGMDSVGEQARQDEIQLALNSWLKFTGVVASTPDPWDGDKSVRFGWQKSLGSVVAGPGTLTFWWKIAKGGTYGYRRVHADGKELSAKVGDGNDTWQKQEVQIEGNGNHTLAWDTEWKSNLEADIDHVEWNSSATTIPFDGTSACVLNGAAFLSKDLNDFSASISFAVAELDRVNRLMTFAGQSIYLDIENRLIFNERATDFVVESTGRYYTLLIRQNDDGVLSLYAGPSGSLLEKVLETNYLTLLDFKGGDVSTDFLKLGYTTLPTAGYLTAGNMKDFRFWIRGLTDEETTQIDVMPGMMEDDSPKYAPAGSVWNYFPMDGNMFSTTSSSATPSLKGNIGLYVSEFYNRYGIRQRALESGADGNVSVTDMRTLFGSKELDATYSLWFYVEKLPSSGATSLIKRYWSGRTERAPSDLVLEVSVLPSGAIQLNNNGTLTSFDANPVLEKRWYMLTLVGVAERTLQVYLDCVEIGNVSSAVTMGYKAWGNYGSDADFMRGVFGGGACAIDDLVIYHQSLTSAEVRELYNASKAKVVYHTVKQGIQTATLSKTSDVVAAEGENSSVQLTLAQNVNWEATANCDWLHVTSDTEGAGSSLVTYTVDANPYVTARTGTMTIAGVTLTIEQIGLEAEVECEKTFFDSVESDMGFINVYTEANGIWTAVSNDDWIQIDPDTEEGNGAGPCWFYIDDYPLTTQSRTGSITIAGKTVYITQSGYKLSIEPAVAEVGSNAGAGQIGVAASIDQVWDVLTDCDWIQIVSGRNGIGNGTVQYQFTDNTTGETRTGTIIIGGQKYTLTQRTTLPVNAQIVGNGSVTGTGNYNQGSKATLRAIPASGQVFSHWSGDAVGNDDSVEITVDIEKNVTATFIPEAAAQKLAEQKAAQGGFYTRDQIHALEMGNLVFDVDASGTARVGVQLMETSDLTDPNSWKPATLNGNPDVGQDGTVGMKVKAEGNAKFFKVVMPEQ